MFLKLFVTCKTNQCAIYEWLKTGDQESKHHRQWRNTINSGLAGIGKGLSFPDTDAIYARDLSLVWLSG